jgi:protein-S-isoprenylcysteine O-methyltransferase Ste14
MDNRLKIGNFLFKYRGIIPVPFIILILLFGSKPFSLNLNYLFQIAIIISILGEIIRFTVAGYAKGETSGRGNSIAADFITDYGLYSIIRNPLYIGNFLIFLGFIIYSRNILFIILGSIFFFIYYYYIVLAEENFLKIKFKEKFNEFTNKTGRFFPKQLKYTPPPHHFNFKAAVFREKDTIFIWIISFLLIDERLCNFCSPDKTKISVFFISLILWIIINLYKRGEKNEI